MFQCLAGILRPQAGRITLNDIDLLHSSRAERLHRVCYMPQSYGASAALTVFEVILLARQRLDRERSRADDLHRVDALLRQFDIEALADRLISDLSGGQQQLVSLCQALARDAQLFLLDEPTSALDLKRQLQVLSQLAEETRRRDALTIIAVHDLSLAARFADHVLVLAGGTIRAAGPTEAVFTSGVIEQTFDVDIELLRGEASGLVVAASLHG
ncbi:MAG: ABC transporter ATP-binding protein [Pseudomonadota bacterium]